MPSPSVNHLLAPIVLSILALWSFAEPAAAQSVRGPLVQWGNAFNGQGNNQPALAGPFTAISAGNTHSLALRADGSLVQWGDTSNNQAVGQPALAGPYAAIAAGSFHSLALRADGSLVQWGGTSFGQALAQPTPAGPYTAVAAGNSHSLALGANGWLVQWGGTGAGQLNNQPPLNAGYVAIAAGGAHSLALRADGSLVQWGNTSGGQTNNQPSLAGPYVAIAAGAFHSLALRADGSLVQWGDTSAGQTNNQPSLAGPYVAIAAGIYHSLALRADGSLVQWGDTNYGQANNQPAPAGPYSAIACGATHNLAIAGPPALVTFTYQGVLTGASGPVDLRFKVYDTPNAGTAIASSAVSGITPGAGGVVTASVILRSVDFSGPRWLEVAVAPAGSGTFTTLTPRQPINQAPRANYADRAGAVPWSGISNVPPSVSNAFSPWNAGSEDSIYYMAGKVGIATTTPALRLDVNGRIRLLGPLQTSSTPTPTTDLGLYSATEGNWLRLVSNNASIQFYTNYSDGSGATNGTAAMTVAANGNVGIGNSGPTQRLTVNGNVLANNIAVPSSIRFKDHVSTMDDALESLMKLEGVRFDWKPEWAKQRPGREHDIGFVAEDVAKVFPEVVFYDEDGNVTGMDYSRLTAVAVQAIKELKAENDDLKARLERIEAKLK